MRNVRMMLAAATLLIAVWAAAPASAQQEIVLESLQIELWPEYDQPSMLVLYTGQVLDAAEPVDLTFTLPPDADLHVVAYVHPEAGLTEITERKVSGAQVTFTTPNGTFRVEFYDPGLEIASRDREYSFVWAGDYAVSSLNWVIQQPPGTSRLTTDPTSTGAQGLLGLTYYSAEQGPIEQGEQASMHVTYSRGIDTLTVNMGREEVEAPPVAVTPERSNIGLIIAGVVTVLGLAGMGWALLSQNRSERRAARRSARRAQAETVSQPAAGRFCTQCGTQAMDDADQFCRKCGAALR